MSVLDHATPDQFATPDEKEAAYDRIVAAARKTLDRRPLLLDEMVEMFDSIYAPNYSVMSINEIAFHFTEEIGEVAEQIREIRAWETQTRRRTAQKDEILEHLRRELGDVFSWTAGLVNKINNGLEGNAKLLEEFGIIHRVTTRIPLSTIVLKYYSKNGQMVCRTCRLPKCDIKKHRTTYQLGN